MRSDALNSWTILSSHKSGSLYSMNVLEMSFMIESNFSCLALEDIGLKANFF